MQKKTKTIFFFFFFVQLQTYQKQTTKNKLETNYQKQAIQGWFRRKQGWGLKTKKI